MFFQEPVLQCFWSKNIRKIVKKYEFLTFLQNRQKVKKQHFYTKNFDAEFEKEVFFFTLNFIRP